MKRIIKKVWSVYSFLCIKLKERHFERKLGYLYYNNDSDSLMIIFSAFSGSKRRYNYVRGLRSLNMDRLYILDPWGYKGSYNLYEDGVNRPEIVTQNLINSVLSKGKYKNVYTAGSSKGGTCAIYFGLPIGATAIFSGACQYNLGSYLHREDHEQIFLGMMGMHAGQKEADLLNSIMPNQISRYSGTKSIVHLVYSKNELTYERQIVDLLSKLKECNIKTLEKIEQFYKHEEIGECFLKYLQSYFKIDKN